MQLEDHNSLLSNTEEIIFQSAINIFLIKGYDGTRMQDIADEAKLNKALLHYYFRSKEDLFKKVLKQLMSQFVELISTSLFSNNDNKNVMLEISNHHSAFYRYKSGLPLFILNTMHKYPKMVIDVLDTTNVRHVANVLMGHKTSNSDMSEKEVLVWFMSFISMRMMPLLGKDLFKYILKLDEDEYKSLAKKQGQFALKLLEK